MSFVTELKALPMARLRERSLAASPDEVRAILRKDRLGLDDFAALISSAAGRELETLARRSHALTRQRFGKVIRLFAPLYLSNECINSCTYCGFSRENPILRVTLSVEEVRQEAKALMAQGFRNILLVAGEHPRFVSGDYVRQCIAALHEEVPSLSLEIGPLSEAGYRPLVQAGAEGLVIYQETYDQETYARMHLSGPKRDFENRVDTPERAYQAGFKRLGIGALYGLADWRTEAIALAAHAQYLLRHCWKASLTISLPRLRPCAGEFAPLHPIPDREMVQLVCALRILFPDVGLVLSTREPAKLRDGLIPLGITLISAGSHTEPGGYTGAGSRNTHHTVRGRIQPVTPAALETSAGHITAATGQFEIADSRPVEAVTEVIRRLGCEPVWKDWDAALTA